MAMKNSGIGHRLKLIRGERTQTNFGEEYGIQPATLSKLETNSKFINPVFLKKLSENENINLNWLITGVGSQYLDNNIIQEGNIYHYKLPLIGSINSKTCKISLYKNHKSLREISLFENFSLVHLDNVDSKIALMEIDGNNLHPKFHDHDILMIDRSLTIDKLSNNAFCIFVHLDNNMILRRYNQHTNFTLLEPLNPELPTLVMGDNNISLYGVAIHLFRSLH